MMNKYIALFIAAYSAIINITAIIMTVADKRRAIKSKWRIPEKSLLIVGLMGGAVSMLITMKSIHHKTLHKKFMIGLPLEIAFQAAVIILLIWLSYSNKLNLF